MKYLLDTCAVSEAVKKKPDVGLMKWLSNCDEEAVFISALTIGEIQKGISRLKDSHRALQLQHWLDQDLQRRFDGRILPVTTDVASTCGAMLGEAEMRGVSISAIDGLIGATALEHNLTVVTRNVDDIAATRARTLSPWADIP